MPNASDDFYAQQGEALSELANLHRQRRHLYETQRLLCVERLNLWQQIVRQHKPAALARLQAQVMDITGQLVAVRLELEDLTAQNAALERAYELRRQKGF
jgi:hypothetical protein